MKLKKKCQSAVLSFLERRYPGIRDIVNLLGKYFVKLKQMTWWYLVNVLELLDKVHLLITSTKI